MALTYYFSTSPSKMRMAIENGVCYSALLSFAYMSSKLVSKAERVDAHEIVKLIRSKGHHTMLDSGAVTNLQKPGTVTMERYCEYLKSHKDLWTEYVMLDDLGNKTKTIKAYEHMRKNGFSPLFVDQLRLRDGGHLAAIQQIWKREKKLALSAWGTANIGGTKPDVQTSIGRQFISRAELGRKVNTHTHLLAISSLAKFLPFLDVIDSVDSASWARNPSYGWFHTFECREMGGVKIPFLKNYSHPLSNQQHRPPPPEVMKRWRAFAASRKWKGGTKWTVVEFFCINQIQEYVKAINSLGSKVIREALTRHKEATAKLAKETQFDLGSWDWDGIDVDEGDIDKAIDKQTEIQTVILSKEKFKSLAAAKKWIKDHDLKTEHGGKGPDETETSYRFRQRDPGDFQAGSFRTIQLTDGVQAVIGKPKPMKAEKGLTAAQQAECDAESEKIREAKKKPDAKRKHKFRPAKYTHKNGHPRCLVCGDEETTDGMCGGVEKIEVKLLPVEKASEDKQIVFGIVLEPNEVDSQDDTIKADEIEQAAHLWLARFQDRGLMHQQIVNSKIEIYESYVATTNLTIGSQKVKKGTWLLMYHVLDDALWKDIKTGKLTGLSMGGFARRKPTGSAPPKAA